MFTGDPIPGNVDLHARDFHGEPFYDVPALTTDPRFRDSMRLITQYSPATIHDTVAVLLSPGGASVLPLYDFPGSAESAGAPIQH